MKSSARKTIGGGTKGDVFISDASGVNSEGDPASQGKSCATVGTKDSHDCPAKRSRDGGI